MLKSLKELKRELGIKFSDKEHIRDEEGRVVVEMNVRDDTNFLSDFSKDDNPVISGDVAEYLEDRTSFLPPKEQLSLHIHSSCIDEAEQAQYRRAISSYYTDRYYAGEREYRRNLVAAILLAVAGVLVLAFMIMYEHFFNNAVWIEVIDIVAWVLLWEAADLFLLQNRLLKVRYTRYLSLAAMRVTFIPKN